MASQYSLLSNESEQDPTVKEGVIKIKTHDGDEYKQGYAILCKPSYLYLYKNESKTNLIEKVDLRSKGYDCVRDPGKESNQFYLVNFIGQKPYVFESLPTQDNQVWIKPSDEDKEDYIKLETIGNDWEQNWIDKIKKDIIDMNKSNIKSKL